MSRVGRQHPAAGSSALATYGHLARRRLRWRLTAALVVLVLTLWAVALVVGPHRRLATAALLLAGAALVGMVAVAAGGDVERWARGAEAEQSTAELLSCLPARRWVVRHDLALPASRANIDHVVVGRTGVWVVDTKSTRAAVTTGFRSVRFGERRLDTRPVRWEASVVADRLESAGWDVKVRPLVVVHGHGLRARGGRAGGVRVVPAETLIPRLRRGRRHLSRREVSSVALVLDQLFVPALQR